jgi:hypothetical protein
MLLRRHEMGAWARGRGGEGGDADGGGALRKEFIPNVRIPGKQFFSILECFMGCGICLWSKYLTSHESCLRTLIFVQMKQVVLTPRSSSGRVRTLSCLWICSERMRVSFWRGGRGLHIGVRWKGRSWRAG